ncbi:hypothetical protein DV737_g2068, partial [Chaetothyriales sp. CBS 132003]
MPRKPRQTKAKQEPVGVDADADADPPSVEPYAVLGIERTATADQVKSAYRKAALRCHPDKAAADDKEAAHEKFQQVALAYAVLSDERRRRRYDATGNTAESLKVGDDDDDDDFNWTDFFREQTAAMVDGALIDSIRREYQGSEEERHDVLRAYEQHEGDMDALYEEIMCSSVVDDDTRFRHIIDQAIADGTAQPHKAYPLLPVSRSQLQLLPQSLPQSPPQSLPPSLPQSLPQSLPPGNPAPTRLLPPLGPEPGRKSETSVRRLVDVDTLLSTDCREAGPSLPSSHPRPRILGRWPANASEPSTMSSAVGSAPPAHSTSDSLSARTQTIPAVPAVAAVNGHAGSLDHSRRAPPTVTPTGATGFLANGGAVGASQNKPQASASLGVNQQLGHRAGAPAPSPSPIPQPANPSGGRPPSSFHGQGNGVVFGQQPDQADASALARPLSQLQLGDSHIRRNSSQSVHSDVGNHALPTGPQARSFSPARGQAFQYQGSPHLQNRTPMINTTPGGTPYMQPNQMMPIPGHNGVPFYQSRLEARLGSAPPALLPLEAVATVVAVAAAAAAGEATAPDPSIQQHYNNQLGFYPQVTQYPGFPPSPRSAYQQSAYGAPPMQHTFSNQPQPQSMSRQSSQMSASDRPGPTLDQHPHTPSLPAQPPHGASRTPSVAAAAKSNFAPPKKTTITIKNAAGEVVDFKNPKPASAGSAAPEAAQARADAGHGAKTDEEKRRAMQEAVKARIAQDTKQDKADDTDKSADKPADKPADVENEDDEFERMAAEMAAAEEEEARREAEYAKKKATEKEARLKKEREEAEEYERTMKKAEAEAEAAELAREKERETGTGGTDDEEKRRLFAELTGKKASLGTPASSDTPAGQTPGQSGAATPVSDVSMGPPLRSLGSKRSAKVADLTLDTKKPVEPPEPSATLRALQSARKLSDIASVSYPADIASPNPALNQKAPAQRGFKYDKAFLLQFQNIFKEKPSLDWDARIRDALGDGDASARAGGGASARTPMNRTASSNKMPPPGQAFAMGTFGRPPLPSGTTSEQRFAASNAAMRSGAIPGPFAQFNRAQMAPPMARTPSNNPLGGGMPGSPRVAGSSRGGSRAESKRSKQSAKHTQEENKSMPLTAGMQIGTLHTSETGWKPHSAQQAAAALGPVPGGGDGHLDPAAVQRKVKAALNKMTPNTFDKISDQILDIAAQSETETDGRTLRQVIQLTFEKATDEAHWAPMYANFCRKMLETMSPDVKDENIKDKNGQVVAGGNLFRKYLLNRCQEEFERGWKVNLPVRKEGETEEAVMLSDEYYQAAAAKRRGLGLVRFIGELFKLGMLTERIMHECVKKLVDYEGTPEEAEVESLTSLLRTIGKQLDNPESKAQQRMDVYFQRIIATVDLPDLPSRLKFMLMDIVDLRRKNWVSKDDNKGPKTIAEIRAEEEEKAPGSLGPTLGPRTNSGRRGLGPGSLLSRGGEDSGASSRTGTPPAGREKEKKDESSTNAFSALAALENEGPASPPSNPASPPSQKSQPTIDRAQ